MAFRQITRTLFRCVNASNIRPALLTNVRFQPSLFNRTQPSLGFAAIRNFSSVKTNDDVYRDIETFLQKEIQLEKGAQKHPNKLPQIENFQVTSNGPEVTLTKQTATDKVTVKFNVTNSVNANEGDPDPTANPTGQEQSTVGQLKARPNFTVEIHRRGQILSFLCSFLPSDFPEQQEQNTEEAQPYSEDFQIDEFTIHDGEWTEKIYSSDCSVIDGELYDKLLNLLEEHGIGEEFANQLADFTTAYEHQQYISLLEKLQEFVKK